jgi:hypothetical protein
MSLSVIVIHELHKSNCIILQLRLAVQFIHAAQFFSLEFMRMSILIISQKRAHWFMTKITMIDFKGFQPVVYFDLRRLMSKV